VRVAVIGLFWTLAAVAGLKIAFPASEFASPNLSREQPIVVRIAAQVAPELQSKVPTWFGSVGGATWYANYKAKFGAPDKPLFADVGDVRSPELGSYYLHPASPGAGINVSCNPLETDRDDRIHQAYCALANWNAVKSIADQKYRAAFMRLADELNDGADDGRCISTAGVPALGVKPPWISGATQSLGISVLLRAHQLTGDEKYLATARRSMAWLSKPISEGGCLSVDENGTWIEEYPNADDPNHVFNGHLVALFGVWDYYRATIDDDARKLFAEGVRVSKAEIDRYDTGSWIVVSQQNKKDNVFGDYMQFTIEQMKIMARITATNFSRHTPRSGKAISATTTYS
jgi:hypothetical protein